MTFSFPLTREKAIIVNNSTKDIEIKLEAFLAEKRALDAQIAAYRAMPKNSPLRKAAYDEIQNASNRFTENTFKTAEANDKSAKLLLNIARSECPEQYDRIEAEMAPDLKLIKEQVGVWEKISKHKVSRI